MKLTKKQIEIIIQSTPKDLKGYHLSFERSLGYHMPYGANWSYQAGYVRHKNTLSLVVKVFGQIQ